MKLTKQEEWWLGRQFYWIRVGEANNMPKVTDAAVDEVIRLLAKTRAALERKP